MIKTASWKCLLVSTLLTASLAVPGAALAKPAADQTTSDGQIEVVAGQGMGADECQLPGGNDPAPAGIVPADDAPERPSYAPPAIVSANDALAVEAPRNGIPTVTIFVDESAQAIADAKANDPDNAYGTFEDLSNSDDHSVRCVGAVNIMAGGYTSEYGSLSVPEGLIQLDFIRGRGNSTWTYYNTVPYKRSYKIKFQDKCDLFGMGASKEWALMANAYDDTLLKNRISLWLGEQLGMPYTPQMVPVDVVLVRVKDGQEVERKRMGSYCLSEQVDVEPDRVAIDKLKKDMAADDEITGGYLLSFYDWDQNEDEPASNVFKLGSGIELFTQSPEFESEELTEGRAKQRTYIREFMHKLDRLVMGEDPSGGELIDEARHAEIDEMMDLKGAADYWWIQAISNNSDAYVTSSTYLHKPRGGKLCWGPIWDFDFAWYKSTEGFNGYCPWFRSLRDNDPVFVEMLRQRWLDPEDGLRAKMTEITRPGGVLDTYADEIRASWTENDEIYPNKSTLAHTEDTGTFDEVIDHLRTWIDQRRDWIDGHLDEVGAKFVTVSYVVDGQEVKREYLKGDGSSPHWPKAPELDGREFVGWCVQGSDEPVATDMAIREDVVFVAAYRNKTRFVSESEPFLACNGSVAYSARVELPDVEGYDWADSVMTFTVQPKGDVAAAQPKTVKVPIDKAVKERTGNNSTIATFTLPLSSIEMGQGITSTFSYSDHGNPASIEMMEALENQIERFVKRSKDEARVAYAMSLHDFGRTAYSFFAAYGKVTPDKYGAPQVTPFTSWLGWADAADAIKSELEAIGAKKDLSGSKVKKVNMSLRFDSETTVELNVYANEGVKDFSASATFKGKTFKGKKVSATQCRVRVTGVRAQDLGELIELTGNADGAYSMRCSALSYAYVILDTCPYGTEGLDLMAALYRYHAAAQAIAE